MKDHAWGGCAIICCRFHIYPRKAGFVAFMTMQLMMRPNDRIHYGPMVVFVYLHLTFPHYHHHADVSEGIELVWYILSNVCLRLNQLSQLSSMQYMGLCVFGLLVSLMMIVRICVLYLIFIIKSDNPMIQWSNCHCFRVTSWNNGMRCMSFYTLLHYWAVL